MRNLSHSVRREDLVDLLLVASPPDSLDYVASQRWSPRGCPGHGGLCIPSIAIFPSDDVLAIRDEILRSVAVAVDTRSRPAVLVSGGLDSAGVAAAARRVHGPDVLLIALRAGFSSKREIEAQDALARALTLDLITVDSVPLFDRQPLIRLNTGSPVPAGGVFSHIWDHVANVARQEGADVLLTGEGGDELFARSPALGRDLLALRRPGLAWLCTAHGLPLGSIGIAASLLGSGTSGLLPPVSKWPPPDWLQITKRDRRSSQGRWVSRLSDAARTFGGWQAAVTAAWISEIAAYGPADSRGRLCVVHPLACQHLARIVAAIPADVRMGWGIGASDKDLLRRAVRSWLPPDITELRKIRSRSHFSLAVAGADWALLVAPALEALETAYMINPKLFPTSWEGVSDDEQLVFSRAISVGYWLAGEAHIA